MAKIILICGKICSGKTTYAKRLAAEHKAALLSVDEITLAMFGQHIGDKRDEMVERAENYLYKKSLELIAIDINVIFDTAIIHFFLFSYHAMLCAGRESSPCLPRGTGVGALSGFPGFYAAKP